VRRKREVEQNQRHVRLVVEHGHGLGRVAGRPHFEVGTELREDLRQSLDDQRVIVDHENLHALLPRHCRRLHRDPAR
jgi:hypothetical protein